MSIIVDHRTESAPLDPEKANLLRRLFPFLGKELVIGENGWGTSRYRVIPIEFRITSSGNLSVLCYYKSPFGGGWNESPYSFSTGAWNFDRALREQERA